MRKNNSVQFYLYIYKNFIRMLIISSSFNSYFRLSNLENQWVIFSLKLYLLCKTKMVVILPFCSFWKNSGLSFLPNSSNITFRNWRIIKTLTICSLKMNVKRFNNKTLKCNKIINNNLVVSWVLMNKYCKSNKA